MPENKYNIISISHYFYPRVGGLEKLAYELDKYLVKRNFKILAIFCGKENKLEEIAGIDCQSIKSISLFNNTYPVAGIKFALNLVTQFRANPKATVIIHDRHLITSVVGSIVCFIMQRPYILISHTTTSNYFSFKPLQLLGKLLDHTIFKFVVNKAQIVACVSNTNRNFLINNLNINPKKLEVIYNGFAEADLKDIGISNKEKIVVFATKWIPVKDPDTAAEAFKILARNYPDWKFMFIGEGKSKISQYSDLTRNLEVINRFLTQAELFSLLSKAAIYINSSLNEGLALGIIEAAALGTIPVLSSAPSNIEVAEKLVTTEYIFTRQKPQELVSVLEKVMKLFEIDEESSINKNISKNAYQEFAAQKTHQEYASMFNRLQPQSQSNLLLNPLLSRFASNLIS